MLPRYRVFLGREQRWFAEKSELEEFLAHQEKQHGGELQVADEGQPLSPAEGDGKADGQEGDDTLQVFDLHEIRVINQTLKKLKEYGITTENLLPTFNKASEPIYPYVIKNPDGDVPLTTLRELVADASQDGREGAAADAVQRAGRNGSGGTLGNQHGRRAAVAFTSHDGRRGRRR